MLPVGSGIVHPLILNSLNEGYPLYLNHRFFPLCIVLTPSVKCVDASFVELYGIPEYRAKQLMVPGLCQPANDTCFHIC